MSTNDPLKPYRRGTKVYDGIYLRRNRIDPSQGYLTDVNGVVLMRGLHADCKAAAKAHGYKVLPFLAANAAHTERGN